MIKQKFDRERATRESWFITAIYIGDDNDAYNILLTDPEAELFGHKFLSVCCAIFEDNLNKLDDTYIISKHRAGVYYSNKEIPETTYVSLEDRLLIINTLKACIPSDGSKTFDTRNVERQLIKQIINKGNKMIRQTLKTINAKSFEGEVLEILVPKNRRGDNMEFIKGQTIKVKNNDDTEWETRIFKDKDDQGFWCYCTDTESPRMAFCWDQEQPQLTIKVDDNWRKGSIFCDCELCKSLNKEK